MEKLKHVISARQFDDPDFLLGLFESANAMERDDKFRALTDPLRGRILATLFYEPSTRTRFSFEAAMQKLGGCDCDSSLRARNGGSCGADFSGAGDQCGRWRR
jgi:aspartate carbamoyltransferase catalytic subunit